MRQGGNDALGLWGKGPASQPTSTVAKLGPKLSWALEREATVSLPLRIFLSSRARPGLQIPSQLSVDARASLGRNRLQVTMKNSTSVRKHASKQQQQQEAFSDLWEQILCISWGQPVFGNNVQELCSLGVLGVC